MDPRTTRVWRRVRAAALRRDRGLCVRCLPVWRAAEHVHHIVHLADGGDPFALGNVQSLCASHHADVHGQREHRASVTRPRDFVLEAARRAWRSEIRTRLRHA